MKHYDLNLLTALDALLSTGSVTAAAQRMHLSTPAMSHTLARLREVMGDALFVRAGRKLVPTPKALALMEPVRQVLAQAQALIAPTDAQDLARVQRSFTVRAPDGTAVVFGAALSEALNEVMPLASLRFLPEAHGDTRALREGRIDLDIGVFRTLDPEIETHVLNQMSFLGAVRGGHPLLQGGAITPERFAAERHVVVSPRPHEVPVIDTALAALGLSRFTALSVPNGYAALVAASRSALVASVYAGMARGLQPGLGLEVFELPLALPAEPLVMAWHPRDNADPAHAWLRGCFERGLSDGNWEPPPLGRLHVPPRL
jgi:DNA-binding transcriptional LysR family regulator